MRARSPKRILRFIAILAAALGGCQTAGTAPDSSRLAMGTRLSTGAISAVRTDTGLSPAEAADGTPPRVELALDAGDRSTPASATGDDSPTKHLVADFTVATTVPAAPAASDSRPAAPAAQSAGGAGDSVPQAPLVASAPSAPGGPGPSADAGATQLTLDAAIAISMDRNETLVTLRAGEPVAQAVLDVAEHYPFNPYVQLEVIPYAREITGTLGAVKHYVYVLQTLELAHQQRFREASAQAALNQVRWNIVAAELTNMATTEKLYFTALYQRDLRDLAQRAASLNQELSDDVERRFKSGLSKPGEDITARVSLRQTRKQADLAEANYKVALLALKRQLNVPGEQPFELVGRLADFSWTPIDGLESGAASPKAPDTEPHLAIQLAENLAGERPDVRAAQAGANVAQSNADLARANVIQNLQIGPYYERDELGTIFLGFRAQMNVPVWDSGKPLARQREAECTQRVIGLNGLRIRAQVEVQTALDRYERARVLAEKERFNLSQSLSDDLTRVKHQFDVGQADILNVFATQTALLQEQKAYLDLLNELAQAAADVTLTAGLPPARIIAGHRTDAPPAVPPPAS